VTDRTAVLLLTHVWTRVVRAKLERLRREIGDAAEVIALLQSSEETRRKIARKPDPGRATVLFDPAVLPKFLGFPFFRGSSIVPGSAHYPLLAFARARPEFTRFFVIEHDVEFSGNWGEFIGQVTATSPDFASSHLRTFESDPGWLWWRSLRPPPGDPAWHRSRRELRRTFNPVYSMSRRAIDVLEDAHAKGWHGHFEVLIATILTHSGCKVADLAEIGGFYVEGEQNLPRGATLGQLSTMRWRPSVTPREFVARSTGQTLFHPVKASWYFDGTQLIEVRRPAGSKG
jgi:hypothetical protein